MSYSSLTDSLTEALGRQAVLTGGAELDGYTTDWRGRYHGDACCVVLPSDTAQVASVMRLCAAQGIAVLAQGGNTSLSGGSVPRASGAPPVILNLQRMRKVRGVDPRNHSIIVEAGCVLSAVQDAAAAVGRLYPVSLGAEGSCQIGGTISTNAGGTSVLRYGNTRDNVLGLEVVLPDGSIWDGLYELRKNNTGLDLKHLFIGAEGTMGIVTAAALKLHPLPTAQAVAWIAVRDPQAALGVLAIVQNRCSSRLSAFEMLDAHQLDLVMAQVPGRQNPLPGAFAWHVLIELADVGPAQELEDALLQALEEAKGEDLLLDAAVAQSEAQRTAMWLVRHSVSEANKKAGVGLTTDCAVPVSAVPKFIAGATDAVRALIPDMPVAVVAHLGDGNAHFIPFFSFDQWAAIPDQDAMAAAIRGGVNDVAHALGGTFSAEHGIGQTLVGEMARYKSAVELSMMRAVKHALDPANLLNPHRVLPPL